MTSGAPHTRLIHLQTGTDEQAECLMRELSVYAPRRNSRLILIELEERSEKAVLDLLSAVETCLAANDIPSVRVRLDGRTYMLEPRA